MDAVRTYLAPTPAPKNPVERTAHSAGSVPIPRSVPVGRRSPGAFGEQPTRLRI
jgi:hypothetical protein